MLSRPKIRVFRHCAHCCDHIIILLLASFMPAFFVLHILKFPFMNNDNMELANGPGSTSMETLEAHSTQLDAYIRHSTAVTTVVLAVPFIAFARYVNSQQLSRIRS